MTVGARHILDAMREHGVRRLVTLTGVGIRAPEDRPGLMGRIIGLLLRLVSPQVLADAQRHVEQVRASDVDWTIVRVGRLLDRPAAGTPRVGWVGVDTRPMVSRATAARFMVDQLTETRYVRQMPAVSD